VLEAFEGNTTAWSIASSAVRFTSIIHPADFGTYTYSDAGDRTLHITAGRAASYQKSAVADASGAWLFERTGNGGSETPAFVVRDSATASGTPVTHQAETERSTGYFYRGVRGGNNYWDVDATGNMRQAGYTELTERTAPSAPAANKARFYAKDNGSGKTQLVVMFSDGAEIVLATMA
jgi:hypothetical protein